MKKLMIAAAIVCAAAMSQAASINWKTGTGIKPDGSTTAATGTLNEYVWIVSADTYNTTSLDSIWSTYGKTAIADISGFTASVTGKGGSTGGQAVQTVDPAAAGTADTYYALIIGTYDSDKDGMVDMYAVSKNTAVVNDAGSVSGGQNSLKYIENNSASPVAWQAAAVPEPTSGLLLLLGVAGMALRRRRA